MGVHDSGYKQLFSFPEMVIDLLKGFVKEDWVEDLDLDSLERKNGSYVSDDLREREDDIIWRVKWKGASSWIYIYLLIEFQTEPEPFMGVRLMNYVSLLYQDLLKANKMAKDAKLPPVLPMVVYRGERRWLSPLDVAELIEPPPGNLARYTPSMRYLLLEEVRLDDNELKKMSNLVAEMFRIEKSTTLESSVSAFISFLKWTEKAGARQDSLKRAIKIWFIRAQKPAKIIDYDDAIEKMDLEELMPMLSERMEKFQNDLIAEGRLKGQAEGRAEGRAEAETTIFINLFEQKFGSISDETRARVKASNSEALSLLFKKLLSAEKPGDIFRAQ